MKNPNHKLLKVANWLLAGYWRYWDSPPVMTKKNSLSCMAPLMPILQSKVKL